MPGSAPPRLIWESHDPEPARAWLRAAAGTYTRGPLRSALFVALFGVLIPAAVCLGAGFFLVGVLMATHLVSEWELPFLATIPLLVLVITTLASVSAALRVTVVTERALVQRAPARETVEVRLDEVTRVELWRSGMEAWLVVTARGRDHKLPIPPSLLARFERGR